MENNKAINAANNSCPMCKHYDSPGFVNNAHQIIACWECNSGNNRNLIKPVAVLEFPRKGRARQ